MSDAPDLSFTSAGERALLGGGPPALRRELATALGDPTPVAGPPDVLLSLERGGAGFEVPDATTVTRGVVADGAGGALLHSSGGSGHTQWWTTGIRTARRR